MHGSVGLHALVFVASILSAWPVTASAEESAGPAVTSRIAGAMRIDYFRSDNHLDDKANFLGATVGAKLESTFGRELEARFELRGINPDLSGQGTTAVSFTEAYLGYRADHWRMRIGKQIVAWGRADGINPTDNLTPRDYVVLLPFEEDQRFGTRALTVDGFLGDEYALSLFTTPFFAPSKIPLPLGQALFVDQQPRHRLADSEVGVRLNKSGGRADWSLSYFRGYSLFPDLRPLDLAAALPTLALTYARMDVLGTDFSVNLGLYGLRGELAYFRMPDASAVDPLSRKSYWYYVVGGDRTFDGNLNVNLQLFGRVVQGFQNPEAVPDPGLRTIAVLDAIISGQQDRRSYGMTARVSKTWLNDSLRAELLAVLNFTRSNSYLRPLLSYDASDNLKLSIGANIYRGDDDSFFGRLRKDRGIFAEMRYAF